MFDITGRIITIHNLSDKSAQVVLKKQVRGKQTAISIGVFGLWKQKLDDLKLQKNDKISGKVYLKSNFFKGKWYTDVYFNKVDRVAEKPKFKDLEKPNEQNLFDNESGGIGNNFIVDEETGEVLL